MEWKMPFLDERAHNIYRTRHFIVQQFLVIHEDEDGDRLLISVDTYYLRNPYLDRCYEDRFAKRVDLEGKRLPCQEYVRAYSY